MDVVQTFERDPSSGSQVRVHTNIKKRQKKAKTDAAKINTFRKTPFSGDKNGIFPCYSKIKALVPFKFSKGICVCDLQFKKIQLDLPLLPNLRLP